MQVTKGDIGNKLSFTVNDNKGAVDLTGATVTAYISVNNGAFIEKPATILNAVGGQCSAVFDGDIFTKPGFAYVRVKVYYSATKYFFSELQQITIDN
jgi:hypothetical protein